MAKDIFGESNNRVLEYHRMKEEIDALKSDHAAEVERLTAELETAKARAVEGSLACDSCDWMGSVSECKHSDGEAAGRCDCPECGGDAEGAFWWRYKFEEVDGNFSDLARAVCKTAFDVTGNEFYNEDPKEHLTAIEDDFEEIRRERDAAVARAERAEEALRDLDTLFEFAMDPTTDAFVINAAGNEHLRAAFAKAAAIIAGHAPATKGEGDE